jgi:transcriptional regulator with XRE-family HTH domain
MKLLNNVIRDLREDNDLKQSEIAKILNISQQQYSRYESGDSVLSPWAIVKLADYYKISVDYLMGRTACTFGVSGLNKKVTAEYSVGNLISDVLSLSQIKRKFVIDYLRLQKLDMKKSEKQ